MKNKIIFYINLLLVSILFFLLYTFSPLESDDYWFLEGTQGMQNGWYMFKTACITMQERWFTDTGRLGNIISPMFLALFPKWVFNLLSTCAISTIIILSCYISNSKIGTLQSYIILFATIIFFPWYDYLLCITFGINYVFGIALILFATYFLLNPSQNIILLILQCIICFIAGWIHEGFGVPLACGSFFVGVYLFKNKLLRKEYIYLSCSLILGASMISLSPVFWNRAENSISNIYKFPLKEMIMQIGPGVLLFSIFIICLLLIILNHHKYNITNKQLLSLILITITNAASFVIMIKFYNGPRTGAGVIIFSTIGTLLILNILNFHLNCYISCFVKTVISLFLLVHMSYTVIYQKQLLKEYNIIISLYNNSKDGTIYYDITFPKANLSFYKTTVRQFHERIPKKQIAWYFDKDKNLVILPEKLQNFKDSDLIKASKPGYFLCKGYIIKSPEIEDNNIHLLVDTNKGDNKETRFRLDSFKDKENKEWIFIMPHIQTLDSSLFITDVLN